MNIHRKQAKQTGMATLVVVILLALISLLLAANSRSLSHLKRQLDTVEARQMQKFKPPVAVGSEVPQTPVAP